MGSAAGGNQFLLDCMRTFGAQTLSQDLRSLLNDWKLGRKEDVETLLSSSRGEDLLPRWEAASFRLFGIAPRHVKTKQDDRWGLLLELEQADRARSPNCEELFDAARMKYTNSEDSEIWAAYLAARNSGKLPAISRISTTSCNHCFTQLPEQKKRALNHGAAIRCSCGRILMLKA